MLCYIALLLYICNNQYFFCGKSIQKSHFNQVPDIESLQLLLYVYKLKKKNSRLFLLLISHSLFLYLSCTF